MIYASSDRLLTSTAKPLPEGLCGGPVIDADNRICGIVEGIVPKDHEDKNIAGAASFIPSFRIKEFIEYSERMMLQTILPKEVFNKVDDMKKGLRLNERTDKFDLSMVDEKEDSANELYQSVLESLRKTHAPDEVEQILDIVERENEEVRDIIEREGGDLEEIIASVRQKTIKRLLKENNMQDAEIISERDISSNEKK